VRNVKAILRQKKSAAVTGLNVFHNFVLNTGSVLSPLPLFLREGVDPLREKGPGEYSILNSQYSILNSQYSILNSQYSILNYQFNWI